jgi:hypothetical protein
MKFTHPGTFGLYAEAATRRFDSAREPERFLRPARATPAQYLERIVLTRDIFGDDLRFVGVAVDDADDLSAVTTQPFLRGDAPSYEVICAFFADFGFCEVDHGNFYRREDAIAVFDPWPRNFIKLGGDLLPIDIVPIHARGVVREYQERNYRE